MHEWRGRSVLILPHVIIRTYISPKVPDSSALESESHVLTACINSYQPASFKLYCYPDSVTEQLKGSMKDDSMIVPAASYRLDSDAV